MELVEGEVIAMGVMPAKVVQWRTYPDDRVSVSEECKLATHTAENEWSLTHTGEELTEGRHYWEVEVVDGYPYIGVCRPDAETRASHWRRADTTAWLMSAGSGALYGNGKMYDDEAGHFNNGDRMGVLLDLDDGSLLFFKNGAKHGPGFPAGSVTGPVAAAVQMCYTGEGGDERQHAVRLLSEAKWPAGHSP